MQNSKSRQKLTAVIILAVILACTIRAQAKSGMLLVTVHEPGSTTALPCRAWVNAGSKRLFNPVTQSCTPYRRDRSFTCNGHFVIEVPPGKTTIHVERGKEYWPVNKEVTVLENQTAKVDITLKRWVDMFKEGWYSLDLHCHFSIDDLRVLKQLALADDLNIEPDNAWPDWPEGPSFYAAPTHLVTMQNEEIERIGGDAFESIGALLMFGLTEPVTVPANMAEYPCDAALGRIAKKTSPNCVIDTDKPTWAENVVGMALGLFDSVQLCHNHYHRETTLALCCGMTGAEIEEEQKDWGDDELFHRTNSTYYRWLNCGFKLAATGGTATGVMPAPVGYNRTYVKLDGPVTEANYLKAIHDGRTFATSGPMLILTANGLDCGATIEYSTDKSNPIDIKAELRSIQPLDSLELINNGKVVKKIDLRNQAPSPLLAQWIILSLRPRRSGWIAARAIFTSPDGHLRQAHTSPIYITVDGKPTTSKRDAKYMIRWIDRLLKVSEKPRRYQSSNERAEVQAIFRRARQVYQNIAAMRIDD